MQAGGNGPHLPGANTNFESETGVFVAAGVVGKLAVKGVAGFAVSPNLDAPMLAAYVPELKGSPGFAGIWPLEALAGKGETPAPVARRSFFRVRASSAHPVPAVLARLAAVCGHPACCHSAPVCAHAFPDRIWAGEAAKCPHKPSGWGVSNWGML